MTRRTVVLVIVGLFLAAFAAMVLTTGRAGEAIYSPLSLNWFVYLAIQALFVGVLLPFVPVFLVSWLVGSLLKKEHGPELSFKIAAGVTIGWIVLSTYGQLSPGGA